MDSRNKFSLLVCLFTCMFMFPCLKYEGSNDLHIFNLTFYSETLQVNYSKYGKYEVNQSTVKLNILM